MLGHMLHTCRFVSSRSTCSLACRTNALPTGDPGSTSTRAPPGSTLFHRSRTTRIRSACVGTRVNACTEITRDCCEAATGGGGRPAASRAHAARSEAAGRFRSHRMEGTVNAGPPPDGSALWLAAASVAKVSWMRTPMRTMAGRDSIAVMCLTLPHTCKSHKAPSKNSQALHPNVFPTHVAPVHGQYSLSRAVTPQTMIAAETSETEREHLHGSPHAGSRPRSVI